MHALKRRTQLLELLNHQGMARICDLSSRFQVADETIRRDIAQLQKHHAINRIHGGVATDSVLNQPAMFAERIHQRAAEKNAIATAALKYLSAEKTCAFDSSSTAFIVARHLPDTPLRVVTNSLPIVNLLSAKKQVTTICSGGIYHPETQTFLQNHDSTLLESLSVDYAFISCIGLDAAFGASEAYGQQASFKSSLLKNARQVVLLADSAKLAQRSEYSFARCDQIDILITDSGASPETLEALRATGIQVVIAPKQESLTT